MANILTGIRILCGLLILIFPAFSGWYYLFLLLGGSTDAIDGTVARKLGKETEFGAKFDTAADIIFAITVMIKIITAVNFPLWLLVWIVIIVGIKFAGIVVGIRKYHRFVTVHSVLNKVCGAAAFIPPLFIGGNFAWQAKAVIVILVCILASIAAVIEFIAVKQGKCLE